MLSANYLAKKALQIHFQGLNKLIIPKYFLIINILSSMLESLGGELFHILKNIDKIFLFKPGVSGSELTRKYVY